MSRPIAILGGTGPQGLGLALRWARAGETVIIGSRDAQRAQDAAAKIRESVGNSVNVTGQENSTACAASDLLMLTVPFEGQAPQEPGHIGLVGQMGGCRLGDRPDAQGRVVAEDAEREPHPVTVAAVGRRMRDRV